MPRGFFTAQQLATATAAPVDPQCSICGLAGGCTSPRMAVTGRGLRGVLVVAEAPGKDEDAQGTQLIGEAGQLLRQKLAGVGVDLDKDCWKTNACCCRPQGNATPTDKQTIACRPKLLREIRELDPTVILLLGATAVKSLVGHLWREDVGPIGRWVGWRMPVQGINAWVCPTWHPSYLLRTKSPVLELLFEEHLRDAMALSERPWQSPLPDYRQHVQRILDPEVAAEHLRSMILRGGPVAVDYETNMLRPHHPRAAIVSCAVCQGGTHTIVYPWYGDVIAATGELLASPVKKIASNMKFEEAWTRWAFGHGVRNWYWDTMLAAHALDNRPGITGLKFQAFARLGMGDYAAGITHYLEDEQKDGTNRIKEIDLDDLLLYNGMDAKLEHDLAVMQMEEMKGATRPT
jgi:uracil-DNA glycosylase family 4